MKPLVSLHLHAGLPLSLLLDNVIRMKISCACSIMFSELFLDTTVRQEGGLQDIAIEVLHLLLAHLVRSKEQFGIGVDQKEAFLKTLRKGTFRLHIMLKARS